MESAFDPRYSLTTYQEQTKEDVMRVQRLVLVVAAMISIAGLVRAEQIANPTFENWKKFGEGSSATITSVIDANGQKMNSETTNKLAKKGDDAITVEVSGTMEAFGQKQTIPTRSQTIAPKVEKADAPQQVGEATEKVEAAGKTFDCKVYEVTKQLPNGQSVKSKIWVSDDVPGGVVKMEVKSDQANVTGVLKSFEKK
jgi:hypothetical protein